MMEAKEAVECPQCDSQRARYVVTVVIGFHAENVLHPENSFLYFL